MRIDSESSVNDLHWHDGTTCHGTKTLQKCADEAISNGWSGKILEKIDLLNNVEVKCYSLISSHFDHWSKHGRFVAEIRLALRLVPMQNESK
jgi:hypothetical protein